MHSANSTFIASRPTHDFLEDARRAHSRHQRRHGETRRPYIWTQAERTDRRQSVTWHHVAVDELLTAAIARRRGMLAAARARLLSARQARLLSQGWASRPATAAVPARH